MKGKTCVITGATSGIGRATALALGALGANLVLLGRNARAGECVVRKVRQMSSAGTVEFVGVDLADQQQVRRAAAQIATRHDTIDVLVNNAGARNDRFQSSPEGLELTFACNHLGHFLLTALLLDRLLAAPYARIITVSSGSHGSARVDGRWDIPKESFDRRQAYARSKLANVVFAYELARRLHDTNAVSLVVDPGGVASNFSRNNGFLAWVRHLLAHARQKDLVSPDVAAQSIVNLASKPLSKSVNGTYYRRTDPARSSPATYDHALAQILWTTSLALSNLPNNASASEVFLRP